MKALKQIEDNKYETELLEKGIKDIVKLAIVFKGKEIKVTQGEEIKIFFAIFYVFRKRQENC